MRETTRVAIAGSLLLVAMSAGANAAPAAEVVKAEDSLDGLAVGVELGEPTSVIARYGLRGIPLAIQLAAGTGMAEGRGLQVRLDVTYTPLVVMRRASSLVAVYGGVGLRRYRHGYSPASADEVDDTHLGGRIVVGAGYQMLRLGLEVFGEAGMGYDVDRTPSCSLASGVASVCPHANSSRGFIQAALGLRYYFAR